MNNEYSIDDKREMANKIHNITNKNYLLKIKNIIINENPNLPLTYNSNGVVFYFHNLSESTYIHIDELFIKIDNKHLSDFTKSLSDSPTPILSYDIDPFNDINSNNKYKLSNKEKNIIKRKQYENISLNSYDDVLISSTIFVKTEFNNIIKN